MDPILIAVHALVACLLLAGLAGAVLPFLPGTPLIFLGAFVHALATGFSPITVGRLLVLAGLTVLAYLLEYAGGALGVKKFGGSAWAVAGALVGVVVGLFFGLPGLLIGPVVGAVAGELLKSGGLRRSLKAGIGALVGLMLGLFARVTLAFAMVSLFLWWLWAA